MKFFLLFLLTITLAFSSDKKIILGSYLQKINSLHTFKKVQKIIQKDKALHELIRINHLSVQVEKIDQYHVVSVATLTNYVQLLRIMKALKKYYRDLYALPPYRTTVVTTTTTLIQKEAQAEPKEVIKKVLENIQAIKTTPHSEESKKLIQNESKNESTSTVEEPIIKQTTKNSKEPAEENTLTTTQIVLIVIIGIILLIMLLGMIFKMPRRSK